MSFNNRFVMLIAIGLMMTASVAFGAYQIGDSVADFTLPDAFGNSVSYSDYSGLVVMINFWTST